MVTFRSTSFPQHVARCRTSCGILVTSSSKLLFISPWTSNVDATTNVNATWSPENVASAAYLFTYDGLARSKWRMRQFFNLALNKWVNSSQTIHVYLIRLIYLFVCKQVVPFRTNRRFSDATEPKTDKKWHNKMTKNIIIRLAQQLEL